MRSASSFAAAAALLLLCASGIAHATALDPPTLDVVGADRASITLTVQASASGAPGGFLLEWMTTADFQNYGGWPADPVNPDAPDANLVGVPTLNTTPGVYSFKLEPSQSTRVVAGQFFDETGLSSTDRGELQEGTSYVFRVRALAAQGYQASAFGSDLTASTAERGGYDCTATVGFWKNHPETWVRVSSMMLGTVSYSNADLMSILENPARGNGLVSLAHQLIATKLNILLGALPDPTVMAAVTQADALIGSLVVPPVGTGSLAPSQVSELVGTLAAFNTGAIGPGHCPDTGYIVPAKPQTWGALKQLYR